MAYIKRTWTNSPDEAVTYEDFNRIEEGIESLDTNKLDSEKVVNDTNAVVADKKALNAAQANPNVEGSLANKINVLLAKFIDYTITFTNGWENAYAAYGNRPLSLSQISGKLIIEGIITNASTLAENTVIATLDKSVGNKKQIYAYIYNSNNVVVGNCSILIEGNQIKFVSSAMTVLSGGFISFQ